jgi:ADP-ribose pyrophosphatase YjhB (NUDIX family)
MAHDGPAVAVGAICQNGAELLMVKRGRDPAQGLWSIPGGRVERGEYLTAALIREVKEETDLDIDVGQLVGIHEVVGDPHYVILDFEANVRSDRAPVAGDDVDEVRWVPFAEVPMLECTPRFVEIMRAWSVLPPEP